MFDLLNCDLCVYSIEQFMFLVVVCLSGYIIFLFGMNYLCVALIIYFECYYVMQLCNN